MRTKGGWVINYSCCMTVCVCDYVCVQKHSLLGNTSQVLSDRKQCVCRERLHWELCAVSACTMQKKCLSHFEVRRAPQWQDTLRLGRTFFWLSVVMMLHCMYRWQSYQYVKTRFSSFSNGNAHFFFIMGSQKHYLSSVTKIYLSVQHHFLSVAA